MEEKLLIGSTLNTTLNTFLKNIVVFAAIAAMVSIPSSVLMLLSNENMIPGSFLVLVPILKFLETFVISGAIIVGVINYLKNKTFTIKDCITVAMSKLMPIMLASIVATIFIMLGAILLLIPGIIFMLRYYVIVPTIVCEDETIMGSLERSKELTNGSKWQILGTITVIWIISALATGFLTGMTFSLQSTMLAVPINVIITAIGSALGGTLIGVIYFNLRQIHDGIDVDDLTAVFE